MAERTLCIVCNPAKLFSFVLACTVIATSARALAPKAPAVPDWQTAAGGKLAFEVTSVKENKNGMEKPNRPYTNFPWGSVPLYGNVGDSLTARNVEVLDAIEFAYMLTGQEGEYTVRSQLPGWAQNDRFDIQARAAEGSHPTKDQMRLMMQALLADRFKLVVHTEIRETAIHALRLVDPGKTGPQLKPHPADVPCSTILNRGVPGGPPPPSREADGLPPECGNVRAYRDRPGVVRYAARGTSVAEIAKLSTLWINDRKPILDQTGLTGLYDYSLEWNYEPDPSGQFSQLNLYGPELVQALKKQLGLKLDSTKAPVQTLVIDHIEYPSAN